MIAPVPAVCRKLDRSATSLGFRGDGAFMPLFRTSRVAAIPASTTPFAALPTPYPATGIPTPSAADTATPRGSTLPVSFT